MSDEEPMSISQRGFLASRAAPPDDLTRKAIDALKAKIAHDSESQFGASSLDVEALCKLYEAELRVARDMVEEMERNAISSMQAEIIHTRGWNDAIEAAAEVAVGELESRRSPPLDDREQGHNSAIRLIAYKLAALRKEQTA